MEGSNTLPSFIMSIKATTVRTEVNILSQFKQAAKQAGMSLNAWLVNAGIAKLGLSELDNPEIDYNSIEVIKGTLADGLILSNTVYTMKTEVSNKTRLLLAKGYLWLVKPTSNWSGRELHKLCLVPDILLEAETCIKDWLELGLAKMKALSSILVEVGGTAWYKARQPRERVHVIEAVFDELSMAELEDIYNPQPVITEPVLSQPEEPIAVEEEVKVETPAVPPKRVKAGQLMELYGIASDIWSKSVAVWKSVGFESPDGLWRHIPTSNKWVLQ